MTLQAYMRRVLLLTAVVLALGGSGAQAMGVVPARSVEPRHQQKRVLYPAMLAEALAAAESYWSISYPPLCYSATIYLKYPATSEYVGEATMPSVPSSICWMRISPVIQGEDLCRVVTHEFGHWLGMPHSSIQTDVMYELGPWWATIPECEPALAD